MKIEDECLTEYQKEWAQRGYPLPLEVCRSGYDHDVVSWEVSFNVDTYDDGKWTGGCGYPIAEFTTWREAQDWAHRTAKWKARP